jgi:hypothetical protein
MVQGIEKVLLVSVTFRMLTLVLQNVVVIYSEEPSASTELVSEFRKIEVMAFEVAAQGMIQITPIYEYCYSVFHNITSIW